MNGFYWRVGTAEKTKTTVITIATWVCLVGSILSR